MMAKLQTLKEQQKQILNQIDEAEESKEWNMQYHTPLFVLKQRLAKLSSEIAKLESIAKIVRD